ncbi:hypothetical protein [Escherichia albertii]|uniref:hypothetical protein n=1 Tax=Escherichia albertii TaxID=208962 RepID=UPI0013311E39|nr:hypothetical protein [Escherichia albertii]KAF0952614.1 hypothetical protein AQU20_02490 [Escherichia albertii]
MLPIKSVCLVLALFSINSIACSGVPSASFYYQPWGQGTKYIVEDSDDYGINFPDIHLPQVKFKQLRRVANGTDDEYDSPDNINNDFVQVDGGAYIRTNGGWRFDWLTDGRHILWAGKIVQNPPGTPKVDAATFHAWGRFAADKDSLYFDGERTDDNHGEKQVDMDSLQQVGGRMDSMDSADVLKDRRNLYFQGRWLGSAQGYSILGIKSWTRRSILYSPNSCESKSNPGPWDTIWRTKSQVFVNGDAINADPNTFHIVRWIAGSLLIYRDKDGEKRYAFGKDCRSTFDLQRDKVTWLTRDASWHGNDCRVATIPDVDPEYFRPLTQNVAQYKDSLYLVKYVSAVEKTLSVIHLLDPQQELQEGVNIVGSKVYFIARGDVNIFDINGQWQWFKNADGGLSKRVAFDDRYMYFIGDGSITKFVMKGKLTWFKTPDGNFTDIFAHDDKYIYFLDASLVNGGRRRNETRSMSDAYINNNDLVTVEGVYYWSNNEFFPHKTYKRIFHYRE